MNMKGEDMMVVMECTHCGPDLTDLVRKDCLDCGEDWVREDYILCIVGNDVISLLWEIAE